MEIVFVLILGGLLAWLLDKAVGKFGFPSVETLAKFAVAFLFIVVAFLWWIAAMIFEPFREVTKALFLVFAITGGGAFFLAIFPIVILFILKPYFLYWAEVWRRIDEDPPPKNPTGWGI